MKGDLSVSNYERFSAYLDGQLSASERTRFEKDLQEHPDWRLALEEISATRQVLRKATAYRAPRNFTLSAEMARKAARQALFPLIGFRFSTALATLALVAVMVLQVLPAGLLQADTFSASQAPVAAPRAMAVQSTAPPVDNSTQSKSAATAQDQTQATPAAAVPLILWSTPVYGMGGGGDSSSMKSGLGGGPGGGQNGIVTYNGEPPANPATVPNSADGILSLPNQSVQSLPTVELSQPATVESAAQPPDTQGGGPVLGLPDKQNAGQVLNQAMENSAVATPTEAPTEAPAATQAPVEPTAEPAAQASPVNSGLTEREMIQISLLGVALLAGFGALLLRRRG